MQLFVLAYLRWYRLMPACWRPAHIYWLRHRETRAMHQMHPHALVREVSIFCAVIVHLHKRNYLQDMHVPEPVDIEERTPSPPEL